MLSGSSPSFRASMLLPLSPSLTRFTAMFRWRLWSVCTDPTPGTLPRSRRPGSSRRTPGGARARAAPRRVLLNKKTPHARGEGGRGGGGVGGGRGCGGVWYRIGKLPRTASGKIARGQVIDALHGSGSTNLPAAKTRIETVNTEDPAPKGQPTTTPPGLIPLCEAPGEDPALVPRTQMLIPICEAPRLNGHPLTLERIDRP